MSASSMTAEEMVNSLVRDYGIDREEAKRIVRSAGVTELQRGILPEKAIVAAGKLRAANGGAATSGRALLTLAEKPVREADIQVELLKRIVGPAVKGQPRTPGGGISSTYPELGLVYAINPNAGHVSQKNAKMSKAMGLLADMPDLHLPVMRGPFLTLYVELKRPGQTMRPGQRARAAQLRELGHCVLEIQSVHEGITAFVSYLDLPPNRPSARALNGNRHFSGTLEERIHQWRAHLQNVLQPARRTSHG